MNDSGFGPGDDRRHWPAAEGSRMRDSLFWELIMPEEKLGMQIYLYLTDRGRTGYNVAVWGPDLEPVALKLDQGIVGKDADFDTFEFRGLTFTQPALRRTCQVRYESDDLRIKFDLEGLHDAFSYRANPDGLPSWFAENRLEQTGHVTGYLDVRGRRIDWDRTGHRGHSWGTRDWGIPQHWKWFVAYTESGRVVNGWIWIARGEWGFAGYVVRDGVTIPVSQIRHHAEYNDDMTQRRLEADVVDVTGQTTRLVLDVYGVLKLPAGDTVIYEAGAVETSQEARFLVAVLNSTVVTNAVQHLQGRGEHNPRDFDKYVFQLPIPLYDPENERHQQLVALAGRAERKHSAPVVGAD